MTATILLRCKGDDATYLIDLDAGSVSRVEAGADLRPQAGQELQGLDFAVASERREATATFPAFTD